MRFIVVDDHPLVRDGTTQLLLSVWPGAEVLCAGDIDSGLELARCEADLLLLDLRLPGSRGTEAFRRIRQACPQLPIVVLTASDDEQDRADCLGGGARAYVNKQVGPEELVATLVRVLAGEPAATGEATQVQGGVRTRFLTARQYEVLRLICDGYPNREIAQRLTIGEATVKTHVTAIFQTLGVVNRTQAVIAARDGAWFDGRGA